MIFPSSAQPRLIRAHRHDGGWHRRRFAGLLATTALLAVGFSLVTGIHLQAGAATSRSQISAGMTLTAGQALVAPSGGFQFVMQTDGNAVVYPPGAPAAWAAMTSQPGSYLALQRDGNLVIYSAAGKPLWANMALVGDGAVLVMQSDGNLVEYAAGSGAVWASNTWVPPSLTGDTLVSGRTMYPGQSLTSNTGGYQLVMQRDGNLVAYQSGYPMWWSGTSGNPGARLVMQSDGNAVVYAGSNPLWGSNSWGHPGSRLVMQSDGNVVVYSASSIATWASGSGVSSAAANSAGFGSAATTGVPAGVSLTNSGSVTVNQPGTVISNLNISGTLSINASNVTVQNTRVTGSAFAIIWVKSGVTGVKINNVEVNGSGFGGGLNSMGIIGPATITNSNIYGVENGIQPESGSVITHNYIHDLAAPGSPHYDGIQMDGNLSNITITNNTVINNNIQTSAIMIDNYFGPISNITVSNNLLGGGVLTVYSDGSFNNGSITGVTYANNRMIAGYYGYTYFRNYSVSFYGNVDNATGKPISG